MDRENSPQNFHSFSAQFRVGKTFESSDECSRTEIFRNNRARRKSCTNRIYETGKAWENRLIAVLYSRRYLKSDAIANYRHLRGEPELAELTRVYLPALPDFREISPDKHRAYASQIKWNRLNSHYKPQSMRDNGFRTHSELSKRARKLGICTRVVLGEIFSNLSRDKLKFTMRIYYTWS